MAIFTYKKNGKQLYRVYVQGLSKVDRSIRIQKNKFNLETLKEAQREEKQLIRLVTETIAKAEGRGLKWQDVVERWEVAGKCGHLGDRYRDPINRLAHLKRLYRYTKHWFGTVASELTKGDGRQLLEQVKNNGGKIALLKQIKSSINVVYEWGIQEKLIHGVNSAPTQGLILKEKSETVPKILTPEEVKSFLGQAFYRSHPWYDIWATAYLTGMRSGELKALQWKDIDFESKIIKVSKSFCSARKCLKSTKAGYWRNVPISPDLMGIFTKLKNGMDGNSEAFVFSRLAGWHGGAAGEILRDFLTSIGIEKDVVLHTLRACFATHMLASGVDQATVMKIGGWRDLKTFQIYVRLAGIEVFGATDVLRALPRHQDAALNVTALFPQTS